MHPATRERIVFSSALQNGPKIRVFDWLMAERPLPCFECFTIWYLVSLPVIYIYNILKIIVLPLVITSLEFSYPKLNSSFAL